MAADPGKIRKVNKVVITQDAPETGQKKVGTAANKLLARRRARRTAEKLAVNFDPKIVTGA